MEFWCALFAEGGFVAVDFLRPRIWCDENICWWYRQNIMLFVLRARLTEIVGSDLAAVSGPAVSLVHPESYLDIVHRPAHDLYGSDPRDDVEYLRAVQTWAGGGRPPVHPKGYDRVQDRRKGLLSQVARRLAARVKNAVFK